MKFNYKEAFKRNIGLVSEEQQEIIKNTVVALPGLGGDGAIFLETLVRAGFENFHLADIDEYEIVNFNRQSGAFMDTIGKPKLDSMVEFIKRINPDVKLKLFPKGVTNKNVEEFLTGVDIVFDCIELFNIEIKRVMYKKAKEFKLPVFYAVPFGYTATFQVFGPNSPDYDDYFDTHDLNLVIQQALGVAPAGMHLKHIDPSSVDLKNGKGPSMSPSVKLCAGIAVTQAIKFVTNKGSLKYVPHYYQFDALNLKLKHGKLMFGNKGPLQKLKKYIVSRRFVDHK
jgi:molybdopterin/thiamine biosynthesis adenylyltransferase